jgi:hypothetical protein
MRALLAVLLVACSSTPEATPPDAAPGDGAPGDGAAAADAQTQPDASADAPTTDGKACPNAANTPGGSDGTGGCWPYAGNTGVPQGTTLGKYAGPCTLTTGTVLIDGKDATACGILAIKDAKVEIKNSIVPVIDRTVGSGSVDIHDSDARGPGWSGGVLWGSNVTARRVHVTGGQHSVHCESNCTIEDCWLHDQEAPNGSATHNNAFISNGGSTMVVRHNSLFCSPKDNGAGGGCTADASVFGDFAPVVDVTFERNLFVATPSGGYCGTFGHNPQKTYGANPKNVAVTGNVFQRGPSTKCGVYGPATSFLAANGNTFVNNRFDDGTAVTP